MSTSVATTIASLILEETKDRIFSYALEVADGLDLPVTSWRPGDPMRSLLWIEALKLEQLEKIVGGFIRSGFLDLAEDDWLVALADQVFGVTVPDATFATSTLELENTGGGSYPVEPRSLVFKASTSGALYTNVDAFTIDPGPGTTIEVDVEALEAGSDSSAGVDEIDELVTTLLGVVVNSSTAATGQDRQAPSVTRSQCRDRLGALSAAGPKAAYAYVAKEPTLTGTRAVTRCRVYAEASTGDVRVVLASASGAVLEDDRALVEAAIVQWAAPLCVTPEVVSATAVPVPITYQLWVYESVNKTATEIRADVAARLAAVIRGREIGGDIIPPALTGSLYKSLVESTIRGVYAEDADRAGLVFRVSVSAPSGDVALADDDVATLGTVTGTITFVPDP